MPMKVGARSTFLRLLVIAYAILAPAIASAASAAADESPTPAPAPTATAAETALGETGNLIGGTWQCLTFDGTEMSHIFTRGDDVASIVADTQVTLAHRRTGFLHEHYQYHAAGDEWTANIANGAVVARGPAWNGPLWTLTGSSGNGKDAFAVQMTFAMIDADQYRREFRRIVDGHWQSYAGETCHRPETF